MKRHKHRADANAADLIAVAEKMGMEFLAHDGTVDGTLWIPRQHRLELVDWKAGPTSPVTKGQRRLLDAGWPLRLIHDVDGLLDLLARTR